ncbi:DNA-binding transcriptional repressor PuuR [compost metagenome]
MVAHSGDEFVYVLSGTVTYQVSGRDYVLAAGDSLHFDPQQKHAIRNDNNSSTEVISVGTLQLFDDDEKQYG